MKITIPGCEPLVLSEDTIVPESGKFDAKTSYASKLITRLKQKSYRETKLPMKLQCLRELKNIAEDLLGYKSYYEPLAGVGLSARLFAPTGKVWLNDLDEGCQNTLKANFPKATVWGADINGQGFPKADLIFLDFNDFTLKRALSMNYGELLARAFENAQKFVVLNDCSIFYFRYGKSSFETYSQLLGEEITSVEDYLGAVSRRWAKTYDWHMVRAAYFRESSFQLFAKERLCALAIKKVTSAQSVRVSEGFLS